MIIRNGTVAEFFEEINSKKIFVYGAGKNAQDFLGNYQNEWRKISICAVIDNDPYKKAVKIKNQGRILPVISEQDFLRLDLETDKTVILLTMGNFWMPLESLDSNSALKAVTCYVYPLIKLVEQDRGLYEVKIPPEGLYNCGDFLIPKIIHYCWFGRTELPALALKCIESWKKYCPDFEFRLWNEDNYDISKNSYMLAAYKDRKWAYVSDYARVDVVNEYGGIYLDTDVEILRPMDMLLREKAFAGFESKEYVAFGLGFGSVPNNPILCDLLKLYDDLIWDGGKFACPVYQTKILEKHGMVRQNSFQRLSNMTILPVRYLSPISVNSGRKYNCSDAFGMHHYAGSWVNDTVKKMNRLKQRAVYGFK